MENVTINPWHGCKKYSEGCKNCYVYRRDAEFGRDSAIVRKTSDFKKTVSKTRGGEWKLASGTRVWLCLTSDFFIPEADSWRDEIWEMIRLRSDLFFTIITKRIARFDECLPDDWGGGWDNVSIGCTMENQLRADERLPVFLDSRVRHRFIVCEPLLSPIDFHGRLGPAIESVVAGGESGPEARICDYDWVYGIREQCGKAGVPFHFKQTGANFRKDGRIYKIERRFQHSQAAKAGIDLI